jgi:uncharacterized protein (TIGR02302 family)
MRPTQNDLPSLLRRLAGRRALARAAILFERIWPVLWPPLGVAGLFVCLALLDLPRLLPPMWHLALVVMTGGAVMLLLARGLRSVRPPGDADADRRLERASGLSHRPLAVLTDRPALSDPFGAALWQAHLLRAVRQARWLRIGTPRPGLARYDRLALRGGLVVLLIAAFVIAGRDAPSRLAYALEPALPRAPAPPGTELQAWITPPPYTHLAPVFLKEDTGSVAIPSGSHLSVNVTGGLGMPSLSLDGRNVAFRTLDQGSFQADADLTEGGRLAVRRNGHELAGWDLSVVADRPPTVAWSEPPGHSPTGQQTRLPWRASDDYGVVSLQAELRLKDRPQGPPLVVSIPLPGGQPRAAHGMNQQDLTAHPWAGLPVIARLVAKDAPGQQGTSKNAVFDLPERPFENPVARSLIAVRKALSLHPEDRGAAINGLDALLLKPQLFAGDTGAYLNLGAIHYLLEDNKSDGAVNEAQERLWQLALHMEEGQTEQTAQALERARQAARDALDKAIQQPNDANRQALEKRLQELEQAIERHMQALMDEARHNPDAVPFDPDAQHLSDRDFEKMADAARQAAREGRMDQAQQRMAQLERMLDQLRTARADGGKAAQQRAQQRQHGRQQMGALQDMVGREGGLLDHTQGRAEQELQPRFGARPPTQPSDPNAGREADQRVEKALRRSLGELMQQFSDLTGDVPKSLGEADQAMREAGRQLGAGDDKAASDQEQKAIEALQKGGHQMAQAMARQFGAGQKGEEGEADEGGSEGQFTLQEGSGDSQGNGTLPGQSGRSHARRDPLGRLSGQGDSGADEGDDVAVPEERERMRSQAIQQELQRRGAERERPQLELDYIDRLLKQF